MRNRSSTPSPTRWISMYLMGDGIQLCLGCRSVEELFRTALWYIIHPLPACILKLALPIISTHLMLDCLVLGSVNSWTHAHISLEIMGLDCVEIMRLSNHGRLWDWWFALITGLFCFVWLSECRNVWYCYHMLAIHIFLLHLDCIRTPCRIDCLVYFIHPLWFCWVNFLSLRFILFRIDIIIRLFFL